MILLIFNKNHYNLTEGYISTVHSSKNHNNNNNDPDKKSASDKSSACCLS